jgi:extracellular elastinolytic metalloproteinase
MEMNRTIGANLGVQLVVDALKLTPANPSFLDARDAILVALDAMRNTGRLSSSNFVDARNGVWTVFARFGMGPGARSNKNFARRWLPSLTPRPAPTTCPT